MVERIYHVGLTVSDLDRSIAFYRDILGLEVQGEIFMAGEETDRLFRMKGDSSSRDSRQYSAVILSDCFIVDSSII